MQVGWFKPADIPRPQQWANWKSLVFSFASTSCWYSGDRRTFITRWVWNLFVPPVALIFVWCVPSSFDAGTNQQSWVDWGLLQISLALFLNHLSQVKERPSFKSILGIRSFPASREPKKVESGGSFSKSPSNVASGENSALPKESVDWILRFFGPPSIP